MLTEEDLEFVSQMYGNESQSDYDAALKDQIHNMKSKTGKTKTTVAFTT